MKILLGLAILAPLALPLAAPPASAETTVIKKYDGTGNRKVVIKRQGDFDGPRARRVERYEDGYGAPRGRRVTVEKFRGNPDTTGSIRTRKIITHEDDDF
ncbi:hypothetical protein [Chelatococcus reniformis]|uniref:Antifreeze protein n=1 Tax=Chelatococcus reniformis TaxID=1494448 RepID=A0A916XAQ7_9HYPH|nr:hypothetical protein [Chelatococcus reniformis]GGC60208.1 hypothetical protein GCM10010994_18590 [Chelatococcus reniformis]